MTVTITTKEALRYLREAQKMNDKPWVMHSYYAGLAAGRIAKVAGMDADAARAYGFLHDIGRRFGEMQNRHMLEGYRFMVWEHHEDVARICLLHSFPVQNIESVDGGWDITEDEREFIRQFINHAIYSDMDKLLQLVDALAVPSGIVVPEVRMVDVTLRYGYDERNTFPLWRQLFALWSYFEKKAGVSLYEVLGVHGCNEAIRDDEPQFVV